MVEPNDEASNEAVPSNEWAMVQEMGIGAEGNLDVTLRKMAQLEGDLHKRRSRDPRPWMAHFTGPLFPRRQLEDALHNPYFDREGQISNLAVHALNILKERVLSTVNEMREISRKLDIEMEVYQKGIGNELAHHKDVVKLRRLITGKDITKVAGGNPREKLASVMGMVDILGKENIDRDPGVTHNPLEDKLELNCSVSISYEEIKEHIKKGGVQNLSTRLEGFEDLLDLNFRSAQEFGAKLRDEFVLTGRFRGDEAAKEVETAGMSAISEILEKQKQKRVEFFDKLVEMCNRHIDRAARILGIEI